MSYSLLLQHPVEVGQFPARQSAALI